MRISRLHQKHHSGAARRGFSMTELVVAAGLLVTAMSVMAPLSVRAGRLWQQSRHYRMALDELTNQLDRLTALDEGDRAAALVELEPSQQIQTALPNPALTAETLDDEFGSRIVLSLTWDRLGESPPISLVGWVDPLPAGEDEAGETP